ncbi:hypothetical protein FORC4_p029 (plasmid) [Vibrio parahaemolyticus]|nr:hypothetical protein FORC4_p029 [Vibrio parahaemolyticus]
MRIGLKQKNALLLLHFIELKFGAHTPVKTSYLKRKIEEQLDVTLQPKAVLLFGIFHCLLLVKRLAICIAMYITWPRFNL